MNKMASKDYDEIEKLFCGTWKLDREENMDAFMVASEMQEDAQKIILQERVVTIARDGDSFVEKTVIGGMAYEMRSKLNEVLEWKDKEVDPVFHIKTLPTYENGIWSQDTTPQQPNGGRRQVFKAYIEGDELVVDMYIPDEPSVTAKRVYKKC